MSQCPVAHPQSARQPGSLDRIWICVCPCSTRPAASQARSLGGFKTQNFMSAYLQVNMYVFALVSYCVVQCNIM